MTRLMLRFDMRHPDFAATDRAASYSAALEMCSWADQRNFTSVVLSEHHADDGYLPAPLILAASMMGVTSTMAVSISALLPVLYEPVRLAEEIAVLDNIGPGRLNLTFGLGYRPEEFALFGVDRTRRGALLEEHIGVLLDAWTGEAFHYRGRRIHVTPTPATKPHPTIFLGGGSKAAARRAARFGFPFVPDRFDTALEELYNDECARLGTRGFITMPKDPCFVHIAEDPEKAWAQIAPHLLHDAKAYSAWQPQQRVSAVIERANSVDDLKASKVYRVVTPDEAVELARSSGTLMFHPLVGGLDPTLGWESLQLFADRVASRL